MLEVLHQKMVQLQKTSNLPICEPREDAGRHSMCRQHGKHVKQQEGPEGRIANSSKAMKILLKAKRSC